MRKLLFSIFVGAIAPLIAMIIRIIIPSIIIAYFFVDISPEKTYSWYSGIWHGIFIPINMIRGLFFDVIYKAVSYTVMYNIFLWFFAVTWIYTTIQITWQLIKDSILCYKYGPEYLNRYIGNDYYK